MNMILELGKEKLDLSELVLGEDFTLEERPGGWLLIHTMVQGKKQTFRARIKKEKKNIFLLLEGESFVGTLQEKSFGGEDSEGLSDSLLKAQFPGKVRKILVKAGDTVSEGDKLLLLEAMKMEFTIQASYSTRVLKVNVKEGEQVSPGALLVELEVKK